MVTMNEPPEPFLTVAYASSATALPNGTRTRDADKTNLEHTGFDVGAPGLPSAGAVELAGEQRVGTRELVGEVGDALTRAARNGGDSTDGPVRAPLLGDSRALDAFTHREGGAAKREEECDEGDCGVRRDRTKWSVS